MRFRWRVVSALAVLLCSACGAQPSRATQADINHIIHQGTLRVCSTGDYRPFTYRDPHGWSGMDIDLAQNFAENLGVKLDLVQTTWAGMLDDVGTRCDIAMGGISITPERAQHALYSAPYLKDGKAAIVRCTDSEKLRTLSDIDRPGVRIVVNPGGGNAAFDKANIHHATVVTYPDNNTIFTQVSTGAADAMITDASEIRWETTQNPQLCGPDVDKPFTSEEKAYLLPRGETDLQQRVNDWLRTSHNNGTFERITQKWLGRVATP
jgi:cyclohexadienyl dehydratase